MDHGYFWPPGLTILPHENSAGGHTTGFGIAVSGRPKDHLEENTADDSADADGCSMRETMLLVSLPPIVPDYPLALRQADRARSDFAAIESDLQSVMSQPAGLPTRAYLCRMLLLTTASLWALLAVIALLLRP